MWVGNMVSVAFFRSNLVDAGMLAHKVGRYPFVTVQIVGIRRERHICGPGGRRDGLANSRVGREAVLGLLVLDGPWPEHCCWTSCLIEVAARLGLWRLCRDELGAGMIESNFEIFASSSPRIGKGTGFNLEMLTRRRRRLHRHSAAPRSTRDDQPHFRCASPSMRGRTRL